MKVTRTKLWHLFFHTWKMNNIDQVAFQFCQSSFRWAQIKVSNILLNNLKAKKKKNGGNVQFPQASSNWLVLQNSCFIILYLTFEVFKIKFLSNLVVMEVIFSGSKLTFFSLQVKNKQTFQGLKRIFKLENIWSLRNKECQKSNKPTKYVSLSK